MNLKQIMRENEEDTKIKKLDISEFRQKGFLQEVNRRFFHPLGLALEVIIKDDGTEQLGGIWDYRDDPEGIYFKPESLSTEKSNYVTELMNSKMDKRIEMFGDIIQPVD